jgi:acetyl esterase/lipase/DNA-binding FadR family transcriptional regulator
MALLLDRKAIGRADGIIAPDLSEKMKAIQSEQLYAEDDGSFDLTRTRLWLDEYAVLTERGGEIPDIATEDRTLEGPDGPIVTRVYTSGEPGPTLVFVHGGGWAIGSINTHDHIARWLAAEIGGQVVQIEYSLAPEHPYPVALNQITAVLSATLAASRRTPVLVAGDSAGANLAAMSILKLSKSDRQQIAGFVSLYGAYAPEMNLSSHRLYGDGRFGLSEAQMRWFWNLYAPHLPPEERGKLLSPLAADLSDFPPTLCIGAECDLLLDDTLAFYGELARACVDVTLSLWSSLPHGCMHFVGVVDSVTEAAGSIVQYVKSRRLRELAKDTGVILNLPRPATPAVAAAARIAQTAGGVRPESEEELVDVEPLFTTSRSRLHGSVAHRIAADIIRGALPQGSLLPNEDNASASFGVSRSAYREAIRTLAAKGLVSALPKVGTRIAPRSAWQILDPDILAWHFELGASEEFIRNLFELRKIVEPSAAALAAMRRSQDQLSRLADSLARMARMSPRSGAWLNAIIGFHHELMVAGRNEAVASLWPAIQTTLRWSVKLQMMLPTLVLAHDPVADHARVFEKIASQSAEGALTEMALLIDSALDDTLSNWKRIGHARAG